MVHCESQVPVDIVDCIDHEMRSRQRPAMLLVRPAKNHPLPDSSLRQHLDEESSEAGWELRVHEELHAAPRGVTRFPT